MEWGPDWEALKGRVKDKGVTGELGSGGLGATEVVKFPKEGVWLGSPPNQPQSAASGT